MVIRTRPLRASMIDPLRICVGATSGTNLPEPGTFTRITPLTGSRLTVWPAIGRARPLAADDLETWMSLVFDVELPDASVAVAFAVKRPGPAKACETDAPSAPWPSPKSQWTEAGPLQVSVAVTSNCVAPPVNGLSGFAVTAESVGGTGSKTAVSTALLPSAQAACTWPTGSAATTGAELPARASAPAPNEPPCGRTA